MGKVNPKTQRVITALNRRQPDRVPIGEFFWTNFIHRAKRENHLPHNFDPYRYWDLDMVVINPNMDPHIGGVCVVEDSEDRKVVKTGFGATIEMRSCCPMPAYRDFETKTFEQIDALRFDDPGDERRFRVAIDDQINAVGDALNLGLPAWIDRIDAYAGDFCVFGSVCEPHEMLWRIIGTENALLKMGEEPGRIARFIERLGDFLVGIAEAQIAVGGERLAGLYIWGDVAYVKGMFFSPRYWREVYKPQLKRICDVVHSAGLKAIYHGCGNASAVYEDMIEAGVDAYNPLEAKAGLDVVELKRKYGQRWSFNGNIDARVLATNDRGRIRREVLTKLNAAKGGGYIIQSDHSIPENVDFASYDYMVQLVREHGRYPLQLGEFDRLV
ncbi:MAG TPA: uroporphyrinogen decarboxylase family protein [Phycisphaerae bacterium]|nr:uroporphyrinogen decarboxylase family protein [Phycisphaerae bacterium]HRY66871.1 uroporphyrinogen decarboxylase family protein [Phycisphaerae bacterium]HSA26929.1 uroporphyrinogen decarboxylase family protein [Phycisphaerae bacterium]